MEVFIAVISILFTTLVINRLFDAMEEEPSMEKIITYFILNWFLILAVLIFKLVSLMGNQGRNLVEKFGKIFTLGYLVSFFFVTAYGSYAILYDRFFGDQSLNFFSLIIIMIIHIYIYAFYYSLIAFVLKEVYKKHELNKKKKELEQFLDNYYTRKSFAFNSDLENLEEDFKVIIEEKGFTQIECDLIKKYFTTTIEDASTQDTACIICLNNFQIGEQKTQISCCHFYHYQCIIDWCNIKPQCPCCKINFRMKLMQKHKELINKNFDQLKNLSHHSQNKLI